MKLKISVVILFVFTFYLGINAQVVFTENFDYTAGDSIGAHGWTAFSGTTNNIKVVSPGLTYTGYKLSGIGNAVRLSNNGIDAYKSITGDSITTGSVYASFMVKIDSAKTGDYFFTMNPPSSNTIFDPRVFVKDSSGTLSFGINKGPNAVLGSYGANGFSYGTTYLLVAKYKFNTSSTSDDELFLYVFTAPTLPLTEPSTPYVGPYTSSTTDIAGISKVCLRQGTATSAPSLTIDGIIVSTTWAGIVANINTISTVADKFSLSQNYPNPFNPVTNIKFAVPSNGYAKLSVYNALGQQVQSLLNGNINTGTYSVQFDGTKLNSGLYFYKLELTSNDGKYFSDVKKLMLVK
jgi:hypothetical protein